MLIISTAKEFVKENEKQNTIQFPEESQNYQIKDNDEQKELFVSAFTGREFENAYYILGDFRLNDKNFDYEMVISWVILILRNQHF